MRRAGTATGGLERDQSLTGAPSPSAAVKGRMAMLQARQSHSVPAGMRARTGLHALPSA